MALWIRSLPLLVLLAILAPTAIYTQEDRETQRRLCGSDLADAIMKVCKGRSIHKRNLEQSLVDMLLGNEVPFHQVKRGIVEQCCRDGCSYADLEGYCR